MRDSQAEIREFITERLINLVCQVEDRFEAEFDLDSPQWENLAATINETLLDNEILSEDEMRENDLLNHADALSDESRSR